MDRRRVARIFGVLLGIDMLRRPLRATLLLLLLGSAGAAMSAPSLLPWGYAATVGRYDVHALHPIGPALLRELARADMLVRRSPLDVPAIRQPLYLTDGGWRFGLYAPFLRDAFAVRRPLSGAIVLNRSDPANDRIFAERADGRSRRLSAVIAHETTHAIVEQRLGLIGEALLPRWKSEGYADHVADESTLDEIAAARLRASDPSDPALFYHDARRRVEAALAAGATPGRLLGIAGG